MGIRSSLAEFFTAPVAMAVESQLRELIQEQLASSRYASQAELNDARAALDTVLRDSRTLQEDLGAIRQSLLALSEEEESNPADTLTTLTDSLTSLEELTNDLGRQLGLTRGAVDATTSQLEQVATKCISLDLRLAQAALAANSANATAEVAADGITDLEYQLQSLPSA